MARYDLQTSIPDRDLPLYCEVNGVGDGRRKGVTFGGWEHAFAVAVVASNTFCPIR